MFGDAVGHLLHFAADRIVCVRGRAAHHVALDVAAGGQRREHRVVDAADRLPQVFFHHAVQLQAPAAR